MTSPSASIEEKNNTPTKKTTDFSIEHILSRAGNSGETSVSFGNLTECAMPTIPFTWLQCTRYCPPKVQRKREGPQKRQLGRHPRIPFTSHQLAILEDRFKRSPYLSSEEVTRLSTILQLADIRVKIWFQNRRARERRERQQSDSERIISPERRSPIILDTTSLEDNKDDSTINTTLAPTQEYTSSHPYHANTSFNIFNGRFS